MAGVGVGVHEGDHHRLDLARLQFLSDGAQARLVQRLQNTAFVVDPFVHLKTQLTWNQGLVHAL